MRTIALLFMLLAVPLAYAGGHKNWHVQADKSFVTFTSTKNETIVENHRFGKLGGVLKESGDLEVAIDLLSVDTKIPIRDDRMRTILFADFGQASLAAGLEKSIADGIAAGDVSESVLQAVLTMNGQSQEILLPVSFSVENGEVTAIATGQLDVADYGLAEGVDKLKSIAGLASISTLVDFTAEIVFAQAHHH